MPRHREPCGCVSDDREWLQMCEPCREEYDSRHAQAQADYRGAAEQREALARFEDLL